MADSHLLPHGLLAEEQGPRAVVIILAPITTTMPLVLALLSAPAVVKPCPLQRPIQITALIAKDHYHQAKMYS